MHCAYFKLLRADYNIPQGSKVMICSSAAHLNPKVYKNPTVFNPWRWKVRSMQNLLLVTISDSSHVCVQDTIEPVGGSKDFMAFGGGPRLCVGADFAKLQMAIFLHCLVIKYRYRTVSVFKDLFRSGTSCSSTSY